MYDADTVWNAREAIDRDEEGKRIAEQDAYERGYSDGANSEGPPDAALRATVLSRDTLLGGLRGALVAMGIEELVARIDAELEGEG